MREHCEHCLTSLKAPTRRRVMTGAAALLAASALPFGPARSEQAASPTPNPNVIPPAEALDRLMQGNARYAANEPAEKDFSVRPC